MKRWEYKFLIAEMHGRGIFGFALPRDISWKVHYVNGKQQRNWRDTTLYNYLEDAGGEGWEVSAMSSHLSVRTGSLPIEHLYLILRRETEARGAASSRAQGEKSLTSIPPGI